MGGGGAGRGVEGAGSAGREGRRVAVVTAVEVGRAISLCLLRNLPEWGAWPESRTMSLSLSGVLRASMISSCALDTECCVPCTGGRGGGITNTADVMFGLYVHTCVHVTGKLL